MSDLSNVQVGDFVISHHRAGTRVLKVIKITPTQIVTVGNERYRKKKMDMLLVVEVFIAIM